MPEQAVLNVDLADVWEERGRKKFIRTIAWGDEVTVLKQLSTHLEVGITVFRQKARPVVILGHGTWLIEGRPRLLVCHLEEE